jgi:hypothetical protein
MFTCWSSPAARNPAAAAPEMSRQQFARTVDFMAAAVAAVSRALSVEEDAEDDLLLMVGILVERRCGTRPIGSPTLVAPAPDAHKPDSLYGKHR